MPKKLTSFESRLVIALLILCAVLLAANSYLHHKRDVELKALPGSLSSSV